MSRSTAGFSLIELMTSIAIIGIVSVVAIPKYKFYQAKSKSAEARIQLSEIYNLETSFSSETEAYAECLSDIGYVATPVGLRYYSIGFVETNNSGLAQGLVRGVKCNSVGESHSFWNAGRAVSGMKTTKADLDKSAVVEKHGIGFVAGASGYISNLPDARVDMWTIDHTKHLVHVKKGY